VPGFSGNGYWSRNRWSLVRHGRRLNISPFGADSSLAQADDSKAPFAAKDYESIINRLWNQTGRGWNYVQRQFLEYFANKAAKQLKFPLRFEFVAGRDRIFARIGIRQIRALT
jgi:hypothetical protein